MKENQALLKLFFEKHDINLPLPNLFIDPKIYYREEFPYALLIRYDLKELSDNKREEIDKFSNNLAQSFKKVDGVLLSPDGKYYLNHLLEDSFYNILIQIVDEEHDIYIRNIKDVIYKGFLEPTSGKSPYYDDVDTAIEEAFEEDN